MAKETGWSSSIRQSKDSLEKAVRKETGWGSSTTRDLSTGVARYEFGIYEEGKLVNVFRTDAAKAQGAIQAEAKRHIEYLKRENPHKNYEVRKIK